MAKINKFFVAISLILIISFVPNKISCKPSGRSSDLIDGNDFLSLFLDQNQPNLNDEVTKYDDLDKSDNNYSFNSNNNRNNNKNTNKNIDLNDDINPLETIMSNEEELLTQDSSNYGQRLKERIQNQKYIPKSNHPSSTNNNNNNNKNKHNQYTQIKKSEINDDFIENTEKIISVESPSKKQIIKMVTSGSKIVFLEDMTPINEKNHKINNNNSFKINATDNHNNNKFNDTKNDSDDIQVISISVSSTVGRSKKQQQNLRQQKQQQQRKSNDLMKFASTIETIPTINDNFTGDDDLKNGNGKNDFINRSHKSEFSIEESEPVTQIDNVSDSVNGESTNIHSILAPPQTVINQSKSHNMPININHRSEVSNRDMSTVTNTKIDSTVISRMERKQDKLVPFQTVIFHDTGFNKDGNAQPRSISYSSVGQSIDQLNAWKDLEGLLEAKQNVSESLRKPPLASSVNQGYHHETVSPKTNHHQQQNHPKVYSQPEKVYSEPAKFYSEPSKMYGEPSKFYSEPSKIYSEPAKVYGQPEKQYGEPSKIYSEPSKVYSEPAKVYSEPAKVYGEPSKVYWPRPITTTTPTTTTTTISPFTDKNSNSYNKLRNSSSSVSNSRRVIFNLDKLPYDLLNAPESSKRLLVPDINSGRRLRPSIINVESKSEGDIIDYENNSNNDQQNRSKYQQNHSNNYHQQQQQHQYNNHQQQNHQISLQNENLSISQMNIKNNLNYQQIQHNNRGNNNNNNNNNNNIQGSDQKSLLQHHSSSSSGEIIYNRPDLVTDRPKYLSITENSNNLYTPTPEQNYEIEESVSVMTNGRANGIVQTIQPTRTSLNIKNNDGSTSTSSTNNSDETKVGYVVEGRNFRKYRVEEKTDDGFIVGEYGVVSHNDGGVRGVRYTADSNINPSLIHQALMKFLSL